MLRCNFGTSPMVALGTKIAPRPPAQIPACGFPAPGSCLGSNVIGLRGIGYPYSSDPWARCFSDMPVPALSPEHASQLTLPSTGHLSSTVSAADVTRHCSEASQVLCSRPTSHPRACPSFGRCLHEPVRSVAPDTDEISQVPTKGSHHVHGVFDCARLLVRKPVRGEDVAFRPRERRSAPVA
jgi:hypothetical protein